MDPPNHPFTFECARSGNCCARPGGIVRVTRQDVTRIAEHLDISEAGVRMRFVAPSGDRLRDGQGAACVFLESDRGLACCAIYPVRPEKCQSWPYWEALSESEEALQEAMAYCPGITRRSLK